MTKMERPWKSWSGSTAGAPAFDPELEGLLNKKVCLTGELLADMTLLVMGWTVLD